MALWVYHPEDEGDFVVAGQDDPDDDSRGWSMGIGGRLLTFRMTGDKPAEGEERKRHRLSDQHQKVARGRVDAHRGDLRRLRRACRPRRSIETATPWKWKGASSSRRSKAAFDTKRPLYLGQGVVNSPPDGLQTRYLLGRRHRGSASLQSADHGAGGRASSHGGPL